MLVAVETSDLVGSTKLNEQTRLMAISAIKSNLTDLQSQHLAQYEVFRGDSYQVLYKNASLAAKNALVIKLALLSQLTTPVKLTQSVTVGTITQPMVNLGESMDPVFVLSGRQLEALSSAYLAIDLGLSCRNFELATKFMNTMVELLTQKQAEILYWQIQLDFPEQKVIASRLGMSRQNVNTHSLRAHADLFKAYLYQYSQNIIGLSS